MASRIITLTSELLLRYVLVERRVEGCVFDNMLRLIGLMLNLVLGHSCNDFAVVAVCGLGYWVA